jgi:hypothetical protein
MQSVNDIAVGYGRQVEALLERLGARGPVKGAGELLDQVKHLIDPEGLRKVRWFLKLRNRVVHGKPVEMPMPSREEVERAGRAAVAVLEGVLAARARQANATFRPPQENERQASGKGFEEPPGPVYRIQERDGAYEIWVGPGGVWVVAETREALEQARLDAEVRLVPRFPRLAVRGALRMRRETLEARVRCGRRRLSPEETLEAVRMLSRREPVQRGDDPLSGRVTPIHQKARSSDGAKGQEHRMRQVTLERVPATFYVGPAGVLVVAEFPLIAETEARRVWEGSGRAISALPVVLNPKLKEPQGRVDGVLALRDEGAIKDYLRGKRLLDNDEVDLVAGWLQNRTCPAPSIRPKGGRYRLREEEVTEGRTKAPPAFVVELVPPGAPPRPHLGQVAWRALGWRVVFLPELAMFVLPALDKRGAESLLLWLLVGGLLLRFWASFGNDDLLGWKRRVLLAAGVLELAFVWTAMSDVAAHPGKLLSMWYWVVILVPGLISLFRGIWLFWSGRKPFRVYFPPRSRVR